MNVLPIFSGSHYSYTRPIGNAVATPRSPLRFGEQTTTPLFSLRNSPLVWNTLKPVDPDNMSPYEHAIKCAQSWSKPVSSKFQVGVVLIGDSGKAYLGPNVEFPQQGYGETIHGEHFAMALAKLNGETGVKHLVLCAPSCGHCLAFMLESGNPDLPYSFINDGQWVHSTSKDLMKYRFTLSTPSFHALNNPPRKLKLISNRHHNDPVAQKALEAASHSYNPASGDWCGVALRLKDNTIIPGTLIESAAYNPSLPPLHMAIAGLIASKQSYYDIADVVLVEPQQTTLSYADNHRNLLRRIAPQARFRVLKATEAT